MPHGALPGIGTSPCHKLKSPSTDLPGATAHSCLARGALSILTNCPEASTVYNPLLTPFCALPAPTSTSLMLTSHCAFIAVLQSPATLPSTARAQPLHCSPRNLTDTLPHSVTARQSQI